MAVKGLRRNHRALTAVDRWVAARKLAQAAALVAFLALIVLSRHSGASPQWVSLPLRLDPLVALSTLLSSKTFLAGTGVALSVVLLTLVAGRAWCGWLCPLGTLLDVFSFQRLRRREKAPPEAWRAVKHGLLMIILISALFGSLTLLVLDPLTIVYRSFTLAVLPAFDHIVTAVEKALYPIPFLSKSVLAFDRWLRPGLLPTSPIIYREAFLFGAIFAGVILLNRVAHRFWCRYLCPLGSLLGLIAKVSVVRRTVGAGCTNCGLCERSCPTGAIDPQRGYTSDPAECTLCLDCFQSCPRSTLSLAPHLRPAHGTAYDPSRRQALAALGISVGAAALFRSDAGARHPHSFLLRPPGAVEDDLIRSCARCGACMAACPTGALQPAITEAGLEGLWTPVVTPRLGHCDYACTACGPVCPVQAIPALSLEEKRAVPIGKAYIDQNRCLAWGSLEDCIICEEMCPVPNKAIHLERTQVVRGEGQTAVVLLPYVERQRCIGCGICENKCPVSGDSAIRVYRDEHTYF